MFSRFPSVFSPVYCLNKPFFLGPRPAMPSSPRGRGGGSACADASFAGTSCYGENGRICIQGNWFTGWTVVNDLGYCYFIFKARRACWHMTLCDFLPTGHCFFQANAMSNNFSELATLLPGNETRICYCLELYGNIQIPLASGLEHLRHRGHDQLSWRLQFNFLPS